MPNSIIQAELEKLNDQVESVSTFEKFNKLFF